MLLNLLLFQNEIMEHPNLLNNIKEENIYIEIKQEEVSFEHIEIKQEKVSFELLEEEESYLVDEIKEERVLDNETKEDDSKLVNCSKGNADYIYHSKMMEFINVKVEEEVDHVWYVLK